MPTLVGKCSFCYTEAVKIIGTADWGFYSVAS